MTLVALVLLPGLGAACRGERQPDAIPAGVPGSYVYAASGSALNKFSWQFAATLDLKPDGTFSLTLDKTMNGEKDTTERTSGTYTVSGDRLWITGFGEGAVRTERRGLVIRRDSLIGEVGWTTHIVLRGLGAPDPVFVKRTAT